MILPLLSKRVFRAGMMALVLLGCLAVPRAHAQEAPPPAVFEAIVYVQSDYGRDDHSLGAGIIFGYQEGPRAEDARLYILTARHVVYQQGRMAEQVRVRFFHGGTMDVRARIKEHTPELDLAVLEVRGVAPMQTSYATLRSLGDTLTSQDRLVGVGHPSGNAWDYNRTAYPFKEQAQERLRFETSVLAPGYSGGGLFDAQWRLVGMIQQTRPPDGLAVAIDEIVAQLTTWGYAVHWRREGRPVSRVSETASRPARREESPGAMPYTPPARMGLGLLGGPALAGISSFNTAASLHIVLSQGGRGLSVPVAVRVGAFFGPGELDLTSPEGVAVDGKGALGAAIELVVQLATDARLRPEMFAGGGLSSLGGNSHEADYDLQSTTTPMITYGGGISFVLSERIDLLGQLRASSIFLQEGEFMKPNGDVFTAELDNLMQLRLLFGLVYRF